MNRAVVCFRQPVMINANDDDDEEEEEEEEETAQKKKEKKKKKKEEEEEEEEEEKGIDGPFLCLSVCPPACLSRSFCVCLSVSLPLFLSLPLCFILILFVLGRSACCCYNVFHPDICLRS